MRKTLQVREFSAQPHTGLTPAKRDTLSEAAVICLEEQSHESGVELAVSGAFDEKFILEWDAATERMIRCYADKEEATEDGAYCVAIITIAELTSLLVTQKSRKGNGFDFHLGNSEDKRNFLDTTILEVSGIRNGSESTIKKRMAEKNERLNSYQNRLPGYIAIVEFGTPLVDVLER